MKNLIVALFAASSLFVAVPLPAVAGTDVAAACDGAVPEAWQRPGGFCDQSDSNKSLTGPSDGESCTPITLAMLGSDDDARMLVALPASSCCETGPVNYKFDRSLGRVIVADVPCGSDCTGLVTDPALLDSARDRVVLVAC
jgi:hypothetical protein